MAMILTTGTLLLQQIGQALLHLQYASVAITTTEALWSTLEVGGLDLTLWTAEEKAALASLIVHTQEHIDNIKFWDLSPSQ